MANETEVAVPSIKRGMRVNVDYVKFLSALKASKLSITPGNRDAIKSAYEQTTELRFTNLPRVSSRVQRDEVVSEFSAALKESKLSMSEFQKMDEQIRKIVTVKSA